MMGKMAEEMAGVMTMSAVGMRERQRQRRRIHGRNKALWEINFREERGDDGDGGGDEGQWRWRF